MAGRNVDRGQVPAVDADRARAGALASAASNYRGSPAPPIHAEVGRRSCSRLANGLGDIISIKIAKEVVDPEDTEMLEDLILSGVKQAIEKGKGLAQSEMGRLTSGLGLPPGMM